MTRRKFNADLATATNISLDGISAVQRGDDDGQLDFAFAHAYLDQPLTVRLVSLDIDNYPRHGFLAFTANGDHAPPSIMEVIQQITSLTENKSVADTLHLLSRNFNAALEPSDDQDSVMTDYEDELEVYDSDRTARPEEDQDEYNHTEDEDSGGINEYGELEYSIEDDEDLFGLENSQHESHQLLEPPNEEVPERLIADLRMAQSVGFKIGFVSSSVFTLSIRARTLGLSTESLAAWNVDPSEWLVLLVRVQGGYAPAELFANPPATHNRSLSTVHFKFGKCADFKPSLASTVQALAGAARKQPSTDEDKHATYTHGDDSNAPFQKHLISDSLDHWMHKDFATLLKLRSFSLSWDESIAELSRMQKSAHMADESTRIFQSQEKNSSLNEEALVSSGAPAAINVDWFTAGTDKDLVKGQSHQLSLPLLAMQFALRYFSKCTSYCMVCHQKFDSAFAAMRPYVCEAPLCLYQYMSLGFGQSLEHEIITQPLVVDLLISFCYAALAGGTIRDYPKGLKIMVPSIHSLHAAIATTGKPDTSLNYPSTAITIDIKKSTLCIELNPQNASRPVPKQNDFVILILSASHTEHVAVDKLPGMGDAAHFSNSSDFTDSGDYTDSSDSIDSHTNSSGGRIWHCKVVDVLKVGSSRIEVTFQLISTTNPRNSSQRHTQRGAINPQPARNRHVPPPGSGPVTAQASSSSSVPAEMYLYESEIDDLAVSEKPKALLTLLDTLPKVHEMRQHLLQPGVIDLSQCRGVSSSALALLKWIVASNRSLIVQINCPSSVCSLDNVQALNNEADKLSGMGEMMVQFKFAQGSPDKERRFQSAVEEHTPKAAYPTIFAWHGSRLGNWHSIIRDGLDFSVISNGRAYGNGVYLSPHFEASLGYAREHFSSGHTWPQSELKISSSLSLCEVVNQKLKFVSQDPHYVIDKVDWIQCRYLTVRMGEREISVPGYSTSYNPTQQEGMGDSFLNFDPSSCVTGPQGAAVGIPKTASRHHSRNAKSKSGRQSEKPKDEETAPFDAGIEDDLDRYTKQGLGGASVDDYEDTRAYILDPAQTDFRPGKLDIESLPKLPSPTWADDNGRKVLNRELRKMQKLQASTLQHELGWYMDFERMENMFHWIVELHSLDPDLPITKDMKACNIQSIVLEIRFGRQFPISPPFVRVIKPRFLPFANGGGGHVTAGGAMCMELLTDSGWSPANSIESVLLQVRMAICNLDPTPARLSDNAHLNYTISEAIEAYKRVAQRHGWRIPPDLDATATGS